MSSRAWEQWRRVNLFLYVLYHLDTISISTWRGAMETLRTYRGRPL